MLKKEFDLSRVSDRLTVEAIKRRRPISCTFELTYRCNFHCKMCYIRMTEAQAAPYGRLRTVEEWLDMARQIREAGVLYLNLTGGECTTYPGFVELYERLCLMGFRISLMSNAGAYTEAVREVFRRYPPYGVAVTLYGGSNETYEKVTGDPKGLDKTLANVRYLQEIGVPVKLNFTMIRENVLDYGRVSRICQELGIAYTLITDITGHRYDNAFSNALESRLTPAERAAVACHPPHEAALAMERAKELEKQLEHFRMPTAPEGAEATEMDGCIGSYSGFTIYWNGEMQTCPSMSGYHNVNPFEMGFEAAWSKLVEEHGQTFRRPAACAACDMAEDCVHNCAARRFEGTGDVLSPDPYTCQHTYLLRHYRAQQHVDSERMDRRYETCV